MMGGSIPGLIPGEADFEAYEQKLDQMYESLGIPLPAYRTGASPPPRRKRKKKKRTPRSTVTVEEIE